MRNYCRHSSVVTVTTKIQGGPKNWHNFFLYTLTLPHINRFLNYFTVRIKRKFVIILSLKIPPYLKVKNNQIRGARMNKRHVTSTRWLSPNSTMPTSPWRKFRGSRRNGIWAKGDVTGLSRTSRGSRHSGVWPLCCCWRWMMLIMMTVLGFRASIIQLIDSYSISCHYRWSIHAHLSDGLSVSVSVLLL